MRANSAPQAVADYCNDLNKNKIVVNEDYQRSDRIWGAVARSYFIESILLEYPIPKIYLYTKVDLATRQSIKEIVDGQQRSRALQMFFNNKMRLSIKIETEEFRGKRYKDLDEEWQSKFLAYSLPIDDFQGVTEEEIQESFRRMNASNVPLNSEEQRNARYQGDFKWFNIVLAREYRENFSSMGLFSKRDLVRMQDLKAYAELACVLDVGFITIKSQQIDALYKRYDTRLDVEGELVGKLKTGLDRFIASNFLHRRILLRSHVFQSVVLALIERDLTGPLLVNARKTAPGVFEQAADLEADIEQLIAALEDPDSAGPLEPFVAACQQKTNVNIPRATRFLFFQRALLEN